MNNIKNNDYANTVIMLLSHVKMVRDFFLLNKQPGKTELTLRLGLLMRKIWNPKSFKDHVSPHELLQEVARDSKKKYVMDKKSDPLDFLTFFLNSIHSGIGGSRKRPSIITNAFQGIMKIESKIVVSVTSENAIDTGKFLIS